MRPYVTAYMAFFKPLPGLSDKISRLTETPSPPINSKPKTSRELFLISVFNYSCKKLLLDIFDNISE